MARPRWSKFWWDDWANDLALKSCSLAARGLWMEMLTIMNKSEDEGYFLIAGEKVSDKLLAGLVNGTEREVTKLIAELRRNKVFSETDHGVIYCRRMLRDKQAREDASNFGKLGGNPALKSDKAHVTNGGGKGGVNPPVNGADNHGVNRRLKLQESEAKKLEEREEREARGERVRAPGRAGARHPTLIPDDWKPSADLVAFASGLGISPQATELAAERMRDWSRGAGKRMANWDATFRNWLRKDAEAPPRIGRRDDDTIGQLRRDWNLPTFLAPVLDDDEAAPLRMLQ